MPKSKNIELRLPRILRLHALDLILWSHTAALRAALPGVGITEAIDHFRKCYGIWENDISTENARRIIERIENESASEMDLHSLLKYTDENGREKMHKLPETQSVNQNK